MMGPFGRLRPDYRTKGRAIYKQFAPCAWSKLTRIAGRGSQALLSTRRHRVTVQAWQNEMSVQTPPASVVVPGARLPRTLASFSGVCIPDPKERFPSISISLVGRRGFLVLFARGPHHRRDRQYWPILPTFMSQFAQKGIGSV
jgi:hypothetical protein